MRAVDTDEGVTLAFESTEATYEPRKGHTLLLKLTAACARETEDALAGLRKARKSGGAATPPKRSTMEWLNIHGILVAFDPKAEGGPVGAQLLSAIAHGKTLDDAAVALRALAAERAADPATPAADAKRFADAAAGLAP